MNVEERAKYFVYAGMAAGAVADLVYYALSHEKGFFSDWGKEFAAVVYGGLAGAVAGGTADWFYKFPRKSVEFLHDKIVWYKDVKRFMMIMPNGA